jgi:hypothetical protein
VLDAVVAEIAAPCDGIEDHHPSGKFWRCVKNVEKASVRDCPENIDRSPDHQSSDHLAAPDLIDEDKKYRNHSAEGESECGDPFDPIWRQLG